MKDYTLSLALVDFIPVIFAGVGLILLALWMNRELPRSAAMATLGAILVFTGGLCKASWKLIWVLAETDVVLLESLLFPLMGAGFIFLAVAGVRVLKSRWPDNAFRLPLVLILIGLLAGYAVHLKVGAGKWFFVGIAVTTIANLTLLIRLIRHAWRHRQKAASLLFALNLTGIFVSSGLARASGQTLAQQWMAEGVNLFSQGSFLLAAYLLYKSAKSPTNLA